MKNKNQRLTWLPRKCKFAHFLTVLTPGGPAPPVSRQLEFKSMKQLIVQTATVFSLKTPPLCWALHFASVFYIKINTFFKKRICRTTK